MEKFRESVPFDPLNDSTTCSNSCARDLLWQFVHLWMLRLVILVMFPLRERKSSILLNAARRIRLIITLRSMAPPRPVGLLFEQYVGSELWTCGRLSEHVTNSRDYLEQTIKICAWLNERRRKEVEEQVF
jgi:hypothetical protein